jgi:hypothetical protein
MLEEAVFKLIEWSISENFQAPGVPFYIPLPQ